MSDERESLGWFDTPKCDNPFCRGDAKIELRPVCQKPPGHDGDHEFSMDLGYTWPNELEDR